MLKKFTTSSVDPTKLSMTVRGILVGLVPLAIALTGLNADTIDTITDMIVEMVFLGASLYSVALVLYGLIRKAIAGRWSHPDVQ